MQKLIRVADEKRGIVQVTVTDERWYMREGKDSVTGLPVIISVPSVTWIAGHWPKGIHFYKWLAEKGWDESQAIKNAAGNKGDKVHQAISAIFAGEEVRIDSKFINKETGQEEELEFEEIECIISFLNWRKEMEENYIIESIAHDIVVFSDIGNYAGSVDWVARLTPKPEGKNPLKLTGPTPFVIDFKTSQYIWTEYELQVSAYARAISNGENPLFAKNPNGTDKPVQVNIADLKMAILQLGYKKNQARYKFTPIQDSFDKFLTAQKIWLSDSGSQSPRQVDLPIVLSPKVSVEEAMKDAGIPEATPEGKPAPKPKKAKTE